MKFSASSDVSVTNRNAWISNVVMMSAVIGVPARLTRRRNRGMSSFVAGMYITSADISVQAR